MRSIVTMLLSALLVRAMVALGPYSGMNKPPMFGDFEAQRHWMEVTLNLPVGEWYTGSHVDNNLMYWGLDYPPLTAYHSLLFGKLFNITAPEMVSLGSSRGIESSATKNSMRFAALVSDLVTFIAAVIMYSRMKKISDHNETLLILLSPAFILIDHGHFQFNCVAHGLVIFAICSIMKDTSDIVQACIASVFFCLALNFKQMTLYFAPAFFVCLLNWSIVVPNNWRTKLVRIAALGFTVIITFGVLWLPFIVEGGASGALQVLRRVFPFERGIFEDKVANFWSTSNVLIKWKSMFPRQALPLLSLVLTLVAILPSCIMGLLYRNQLLYTLFNCSVAFFLFSYQVHEKSILIPLVPAVLLALDKRSDNIFPSFGVLATLSMTPLYVKDGIMPTAVMLSAMYLLITILVRQKDASIGGVQKWFFSSIVISLSVTSYLVCFGIPPARLPDLFVVLHNAVCFGFFMIFYLYGNYQQYRSCGIERQVEKTKVQ